jgi:type IV pilus assembly protein PilQ
MPNRIVVHNILAQNIVAQNIVAQNMAAPNKAALSKVDRVMKSKILCWWMAVALSAISLIGKAANLTDIEYSSLSGDRTEIRLVFDGQPPEPKGYAIEDPARIALDLNGVKSGLKEKYHKISAGNTRSVTVLEAGGKTRIILNLVELVPYNTATDGDTLVIRLGAADVAGEVESSQETVTSMKAHHSARIVENIDFHRGVAGEGRVDIVLSSDDIPVDMSEEAGNIRLEFPGTELPPELRRRLDVIDFATPVQLVDAYVEGGNTVVSVQPQGNYDYIAYQAENVFTLAVEPLTTDEAEERAKEKFPYSGEKLSLNFQSIEVRAVLQLIADFTGLNLVASDTVGGTITLRLQNVPWDQALELILKTKGLDQRKVGNVLLIAPAQEIAAREKLELEANKQVRELAPVRLEVIQINYAKAADIVDLLKQDAELISSRGYISSDERTNTISLRETSEKVSQVRKLISLWDVAVDQVLIEARIVRATTDAVEELGIQWGGGYFDLDGRNLFRVGGSQQTLSELTDVANNSDNTITFPGALAVDLGVTRTNTSSVAIGFGTDSFLIDLELSAFESDGRGEIVAQPKVITADRQTAKIKSGEEIPYQEASSSGATSVSFKEAVLSLEVTPQITPDGNIIMDLIINQDTRGVVTAGIPSIDTNKIETQVLVGNGQTIVLGGIFTSEKSSTLTKTPFLGDIPYIGELFRKTENTHQRSELLVFITPKLLKGTQGSK